MRKYITLLVLLLLLVAVNAHSAQFMRCNPSNTSDYCGGSPFNYRGLTEVVADTSSPGTSQYVFRFTLPAGNYDGDGFGAVFWGYPANTNEVWYQYYWKYSPGFQFHPGGTKQWYSYTTNGGGTGGSNLLVAIGKVWNGYGATPQGTNFYNLPPNVNTDTWYFDTGNWHKIKIHTKFNEGTNWNGVWQVWIDDVLVSNYSNVMYDSSQYNTWNSWGLAPIWGGRCNNTPETCTVNKTGYWYVTDVYTGSTDPGGGSTQLIPPPSSNSKIPKPPNKLIVD